MSLETSHNPLSTHALDSYESELCASLPGLYPDEGERMIVEEVLIPQLRAEIEKIIGSLSLHGADTTAILVPTDVDNLCSTIESLLAHNPLLDTDGLLKPSLAIISDIRAKVRAELLKAFYEKCRTELAKHGIVDRASLMSKSVNWFIKQVFGELGNGHRLMKSVLREKVKPVLTTHFEKTGDTLFPESEFKKMDEAYFNDPKNIKKDLAAFAKKAKCQIKGLTTKKIAVSTKCSNGNTVHGITYLSRAGIAIGLAQNSADSRLKLAEILIELKKRIGVEHHTYPIIKLKKEKEDQSRVAEAQNTMDATYFSNTENIRRDLTSFASAAGCSIEGINTTKKI